MKNKLIRIVSLCFAFLMLNSCASYQDDLSLITTAAREEPAECEKHQYDKQGYCEICGNPIVVDVELKPSTAKGVLYTREYGYVRTNTYYSFSSTYIEPCDIGSIMRPGGFNDDGTIIKLSIKIHGDFTIYGDVPVKGTSDYYSRLSCKVKHNGKQIRDGYVDYVSDSDDGCCFCIFLDDVDPYGKYTVELFDGIGYPTY